MNVIRLFETRVSRLLVCGTLLLAPSGTLFAGEVLTLTNGKTTATGTVVGSSDFFSGTVGNWQVEPITIGSSLGTPSMPNLDIASVDKALVASPGALTIVFSDTGFTANPLLLTYSDSASFLGTKTISDTVSILVNGKPVPGSTAVLTPGSGGADNTILVKPGSSYSITLTEVVTATKAAGSIVSSDILLGGTETPEPGLYAVTGAGLAGLLALAIRRKRRQAAAQPTF